MRMRTRTNPRIEETTMNRHTSHANGKTEPHEPAHGLTSRHPKTTLRRIRVAYPHPSRQGKYAPYGGYDVAGALVCFCNGLPAHKVPGWMRHPTAGDVAICLTEKLGWDAITAANAALRLCDLCDRTAPSLAWKYLTELLRHTTTNKAQRIAYAEAT